MLRRGIAGVTLASTTLKFVVPYTIRVENEDSFYYFEV